MDHAGIIMTLTAALTAALVFGYLTHLLGLSPIAGYLLAGVAIGPHTPGFVADHHVAEQLAEVGVILLMFGVGLHFNFRELWAVRRTAIPGALGQSAAAAFLGALAARAAGMDWASGIVFGMAISVASTVVLARVLSDNRDLHTPAGHIAIGWLVVEDILTVILLVALPALFGPREEAGRGLAATLAATGVKLAALVAAMIVLGNRVIPWLLDRAARSGSRELFTLTVLAVALGVSAGAAVFFGVSMALGAFLAGMVAGRSDFGVRASSEALPLRDAFAVLFFVSVGMLIRPGAILESPGLCLSTLAIVLLAKPLAAIGIVTALGHGAKPALTVGAALGQIGEFSFLLAAAARKLDLLNEPAMNALVVAAIVSITLNPVLYAAAKRAAVRFSKPFPPDGPAGEEHGTREDAAGPRHRAIIVGHGPVGRSAARLLRENGIEISVVEMNPDTARRLRESGIRAVHGDAARREILEAAGIESSGTLILSAGGPDSAQIVALAKELNPEIRVLARVAYAGEVGPSLKAGAVAVFSGEGEVAIALTEAVLRDLGATPDQIDLERRRVRESLGGPVPVKPAAGEGATSSA